MPADGLLLKNVQRRDLQSQHALRFNGDFTLGRAAAALLIGSSPRNARLGSAALQSDHTHVAVVAAQKSLNCMVTLETDVYCET